MSTHQSHIKYDPISYPYQHILANYLTQSPSSHLSIDATFKYHTIQQSIFDNFTSDQFCRIYYVTLSTTNHINIIDGLNNVLISFSPEYVLSRCVYPYQFDVPILHLILTEQRIINAWDLLFVDVLQTPHTIN